MPPLLKILFRAATCVSVAAFFALMIAGSASATIDIAPGTSATLAPEACAEASGYKLPLDPTWGNCPLGCWTSCDLSAPSALAWLDVDRVVGSKYATSTIYGQFTVTDPSGLGTEVDGTIQYDLSWAGLWTIAGFFTGYNEARAEISVYLYDVTNGSKLIKKTEPPVHTQTPDGFIGIDLIDAGAGLDEGSTSNSFSTKLIRGHTYRVTLSLYVTAKGLANAYINLEYRYGGHGLFWNKFVVSVSPDIIEEIALLKERVDSLEAEVARLRYGLEHHTHTYLTGKGEGHNNTEAQTSFALIMEEVDISDSVGVLLDIGEPDKEPLPTRSVVLTNYPNPFNPSTTILYSLPEAAETKIMVYNNLGQVVATLVNSFQTAGEHRIELDASLLASGVYYYRLVSGPFAETRKLVLLK
jgi:hypothetical protein